ncbi:MAG: hypothetical protein WC830_19570 [Burkholderiales bacterium]|jgi:hypothetical protein
MTDPDDHAVAILEVLKRAVAEALERKRRLGQYYVVWRDGRVMCIGPDAPPMRYPDSADAPRPLGGAAEPGKDD